MLFFFPKALAQIETKASSFRIWTRFADIIFYNNDRYIKCAFSKLLDKSENF